MSENPNQMYKSLALSHFTLMYMCLGCGSVVADMRLHDEWHKGKEAQPPEEHEWETCYISPDFKEYPKNLPKKKRLGRKCRKCGRVDIETVDAFVMLREGTHE